jgi:hypothetical protein
MASDKDILKAIKLEFQHFMNADELRIFNNYWKLVYQHNYSLSKKNLGKLEKIVSNIQARRQQAREAPNDFHPLFG